MSFISKTVGPFKFLQSACSKKVIALKEYFIKLRTERKVRNELRAVIAEVQLKEPRAPKMPGRQLEDLAERATVISVD